MSDQRDVMEAASMFVNALRTDNQAYQENLYLTKQFIEELRRRIIEVVGIEVTKLNDRAERIIENEAEEDDEDYLRGYDDGFVDGMRMVEMAIHGDLPMNGFSGEVDIERPEN